MGRRERKGDKRAEGCPAPPAVILRAYPPDCQVPVSLSSPKNPFLRLDSRPAPYASFLTSAHAGEKSVSSSPCTVEGNTLRESAPAQGASGGAPFLHVKRGGKETPWGARRAGGPRQGCRFPPPQGGRRTENEGNGFFGLEGRSVPEAPRVCPQKDGVGWLPAKPILQTGSFGL